MDNLKIKKTPEEEYYWNDNVTYWTLKQTYRK